MEAKKRLTIFSRFKEALNLHKMPIKKPHGKEIMPLKEFIERLIEAKNREIENYRV